MPSNISEFQVNEEQIRHPETRFVIHDMLSIRHLLVAHSTQRELGRGQTATSNA